jgi:hypothetical protein
LWADDPPEEAGPLLDSIERLRNTWAHTVPLQDDALTRLVRSGLHQVILGARGAGKSYPGVLLPDFTGDDYSALEATVVSLVVTDRAALAEVERAVEVASTDPESRKLVAQIAEHLPNRAQVAKLTPWAALVMVSAAMLKIAPEINPNTIAMLAIIVAVVLYLLPPRSGS